MIGDVNDIGAVATDVVRLVQRGLFSAGLFRRLKDGSVQSVRLDLHSVQATADMSYLLIPVDTGRLPVGVTVPRLVDPRTLHHLSGVVGRTVRVINSTRVVYVVDLRPRRQQAHLPKRVVLDVSGRQPGGYLLPMGVTKRGPLWLPLPDLLHVLVGGSTNQGKTNLLHSFIIGLLMAHTPEEISLYLVDTKEVEFARYLGLPWVRDVALDFPDAEGLLQAVIAEVERRQALFGQAGGARYFNAYQSWARRSGRDTLPRILVVVDEIADMVLSGGGMVRDSLARLASKGRAFGVHLVLATQRPDREVVRGLTKVNLPTRIAFRVPAHTDSQLIIQRSGAERLPAVPGRYILVHGARSAVVQAFYVPDSLFARLQERAVGFGYDPQAVVRQRVRAADGGEAPLSRTERMLAVCARDELEGAFRINALYERFRGQVSKNAIAETARRFERDGLLTPQPPNPTQPRRVTEKLLRLLDGEDEKE